MEKKFSSQELYELRNHIPLDVLIRDLGIPSKIRDGYFRFLCPLCNEFQTAVKPVTNLGRCFRCKKNFNTIDLVMEVKGYAFRDSVLFLKSLKNPCHDSTEALGQLAGTIGRSMMGGR